MALERPAILISPLECEVSSESIDALASALHGAEPGQVIHSAFPVKIYHLIDGLWIESGDLPRVLVKASDESELE